jgi:general secretion pathway protein J
MLRAKSSQQGFTLIELLIAAAISVIIGSLMVMALTGASDTADRTASVMKEINTLDRAWQTIETDLRHMVKPDGRRARFEAKSLQFSGENSNQVIMQFKRTNWINFSNQPRSDLQLVNYRIDQGILWRDFLPDINRDLDGIDFEREALHIKLLENIEDIQLRFLTQGLINANGLSQLNGNDYTKNWLQNWPDIGQGDNALIPLAVEIRIVMKGVGESVRLFSFPE